MFNFIVGVEDDCKYKKENILRTFKTEEEVNNFADWFDGNEEAEVELIERFNYTPHDCERCFWYIEDEEETCNDLYRELKEIADDVERIRLKLFTNHCHREWFGEPGEEDFEMVDKNLFKIQSDLRRLKEYLLMEDD